MEYEHICTDETCRFEWTDEYSIKDDPPKICPKCGKETAMRLISGGSGKGIVELTGHELEVKTKEDIAKLKSEIYSSEKKYANFIGEERYHNLQKGLDRKW